MRYEEKQSQNCLSLARKWKDATLTSGEAGDICEHCRQILWGKRWNFYTYRWLMSGICAKEEIHLEGILNTIRRAKIPTGRTDRYTIVNSYIITDKLFRTQCNFLWCLIYETSFQDLFVRRVRFVLRIVQLCCLYDKNCVLLVSTLCIYIIRMQWLETMNDCFS